MKTLFSLSLFSILFLSCGTTDDTRKQNSPTSGKLILYYDEGLTSHIKNQVFTFLQIYKNADIHLVSSNEQSCIEALFNDSCKVIALSRNLSAAEIKKFAAINLYPQSSVVAKDAIAFIVPLSFPDSTISIEALTELLKGNDSAYVKGKHTSIVFDNQNSGSTRHLKDSLIPSSNFGKNCSAVNTTEALIKAISSSNNSIGVCDYAWLSDKDDTTTKEFLKKVKILAVSPKNNQLAYMPDQSNIATGNYPLCRSICIIRRSSEFSLGKGIETFIAGEKGQLMFLKQGLPPNRQEERVIEIDMRPLDAK
jgi:phosphate transport system substrate-binding protein